jgi:uncharacterized membrane protein YfcA
VSYWTVYWFQGIACFVFASTATFSGVTGSSLMLPWLIMGYALLPVPEITAYQAVAASLFLEPFAATIGVYQYQKRRLIDLPLVKMLVRFVLPAAIFGAVVSRWVPAAALQVSYSALMLLVAWLLLRALGRNKDGHEKRPRAPDGEPKDMTDTGSGHRYRFYPHRLGRQRGITAGGAFAEGLMSAGTGEVTVPRLILRSGYPAPIAVATSLVLVVVADLSAAITHFAQFTVREGGAGIPWNVIVAGAPGMAVGAYVGSRLQGRFSEETTQQVFGGIFLVIGVTFLIFTIFRTAS